MARIGDEFLADPTLNAFHRIYIKIFGIPISGMRIRLRRILPEISKLRESHLLPKNAKIADLGCGKGVFSFEMGRLFPDSKIVGIDIDPAQVEINRAIVGSLAIPNVHFECEDILKLKSKSELDLILSVDNLEHIQNDRQALEVMRNALKSGGLFLCHVPAFERIWLFFGRKKNFDVQGHFRPGYKIEELKEKLRSAGFEVMWIKETYGYWETITNNISYFITGASKRNVLLYALVFPLLNFVAWLGRNEKPKKDHGAGVIALARKTG